MSSEYSLLKKKVICFVGIFFSYLFYGVIQEKITKSDYTFSDSNQLFDTYRSEKFNFFFSLILVQCIVNSLFAALFGLKSDNKMFKRDQTSKVLYFISAISYSGAMIASNSCLTYLNYPTQVIGKSIKPIPILLMTFIFGNVRYSFSKFVYVSLITMGVILFMFKKPLTISATSSLFPNFSLLDLVGPGELLLITSLLLDGITATFQEKMRKKYSTSSYPLMFYTNLFSSILIVTITLATGELFRFFAFCIRHPRLVNDILLFSLTSAVGQTFIFYAVTKISPLECSIITTTRKFFTILVSVIVFKNVILFHQWVGVFLVFLGLALDAYQEKSAKLKHKTA